MFFNNQKNFYVNSQEHLMQVIAEIKDAKIFALDTEFTRETTYYPILSLIQIAVKNSLGQKNLYIIDCLSKLDLSDFYQLIADENIIKIAHSSSQDLQIFFYKSDLLPKSIADTQVMANFCGFDYGCGYSNLVRNIFNENLDKEQQRSDWQQRPLSQNQIEYALLDVFFLHEIYQKLADILRKENRYDWFEEEMKSFVEVSLFKSDESLMKNFILKNKSSLQIEMIKKLVFMREDWAKKIDVPRQRVIRDEVIEKLVFTKEITSKIDKRIIAQVEEILSISSDSEIQDSIQNKGLSMNSLQKEIYNKAKEEIQEIAQKLNLKEQFLINSSDLKKIIIEKKITKKIHSNWRYQIFGEKLEKIIA